MPDITEFSPDPPTEIVTVGGKNVEVRGISARAMVVLARRYPMIVDMLNGKPIDANDPETQFSILDMAPTLVALAARRQSDEESIADDLSYLEALPAAIKIISLTVGEGRQGPLAVNGSDHEQPIEGSATK